MFSSFTSSFRAGRRPFTISNPTQLTGGFTWLDGSSNTVANFGSVLTSPFTISTWKDVYLASHDANKGGGSSVKPVWVSGAQNNLGIVRFNAANSQSLNINPVNSPAPGLQGITGYSLHIVAKFTSVTNGVIRPLCASNTGGFKIFHDGTNLSCTTSGGTGVSTLTGDVNNFHIFSLLYDGTKTGNANRLRFRYDRNEQILNFGATTVGATTNASATYFYLGEDGAGNYLYGDIGELILYSRVLSSTELVSVERYLKNKWAINI